MFTNMLTDTDTPPYGYTHAHRHTHRVTHTMFESKYLEMWKEIMSSKEENNTVNLGAVKKEIALHS